MHVFHMLTAHWQLFERITKSCEAIATCAIPTRQLLSTNIVHNRTHDFLLATAHWQRLVVV